MKQLLFLILLSGSVLLNAQTPLSSIGLRGGETSGIIVDYSQSVHPIRMIVSFRNQGIQLTGLKLSYKPLKWNSKNGDWEWFYGFGLHAGYECFDKIHKEENGQFVDYTISKRWSPCIGGDGIIGIAWNMNRYPITLSADYKPYINFGGQNFLRINRSDMAFGIIYHFNK